MELHTVGDENQQLIQPECVKLLIKSQIITSCVIISYICTANGCRLKVSSTCRYVHITDSNFCLLWAKNCKVMLHHFNIQFMGMANCNSVHYVFLKYW